MKTKKAPPDAGESTSLILRLASERKEHRRAAHEAIVAHSRGQLGATGQQIVDELLDGLGLSPKKRDEFVNESLRIGALQKAAGTKADIDAAAERLQEAVKTAENESVGLAPLREQLRALEMRCLELKVAVDERAEELRVRLEAVEALEAAAEMDPEHGEAFRLAVSKLSYPDLHHKPRVDALESLVKVKPGLDASGNDPALLHARTLCLSEDETLRAWGERLISRSDAGKMIIVRLNETAWPSYIATRLAELSELRPRVERAEREHAEALARLRKEHLGAFVPA